MIDLPVVIKQHVVAEIDDVFPGAQEDIAQTAFKSIDPMRQQLPEGTSMSFLFAYEDFYFNAQLNPDRIVVEDMMTAEEGMEYARKLQQARLYPESDTRH